MTVRHPALRHAALAIGLTTTLVVTACGGATAAPTQATPTDPGLSSFDMPTFDLGSFALPSFDIPSFAGDEELEALLPDTIGGQPVIKQSVTGQAFIDMGMGAAFEDILEDVGASAGDLSVAIGSAGTLILFAYQVEGQSAEQVFGGLEAALQAGGGGTVSEINVGGRALSQVTTPGETTYIYLSSDVVFVIGDISGAVTPELLEDAVSQLPAG
jgi:hypothetical protein